MLANFKSHYLQYAATDGLQTDVSPGDFNLLIAIDIRQKSKAEPVAA